MKPIKAEKTITKSGRTRAGGKTNVILDLDACNLYAGSATPLSGASLIVRNQREQSLPNEHLGDLELPLLGSDRQPTNYH